MSIHYPLPLPPARLTDGFGQRESFNAGGYKTGAMHGGQDFAPPTPGQKGYPCRAVGSGRIVATRMNGYRVNVWGGKAIYNDAAGNYVIQELVATDGKPFFTAHGVGHTRVWVGYNHLESFGVAVNQRLEGGVDFAVVGRSGAATGEHLHLDVFTDNPSLGDFAFGRRVDPMLLLGNITTESKQAAPAWEDSFMRLTREVDTHRVILRTDRGSVHVTDKRHVAVLQRVIAAGSEVENINSVESAWVTAYIAAAGAGSLAEVKAVVENAIAGLEVDGPSVSEVVDELTERLQKGATA